MSNSIQERQNAIKQIITEELVEDQATLTTLLKKKFGIDTTQVQVSRDLRKLGIGKQKIGSQMAYDLPETNQTKELLRLAILSITHNEATIVVKTVPGLAPFVAYHLDDKNDIGVLGTVAGEDTVFVTPDSTNNIQNIVKKVSKALFYKGKSK